MISYRPKSALRDSGKALGIDLAIVEKVAKTHHWFDSKEDLVNRLAESGLDPESDLAQQWATLAQRLLGFPRHLSQHPGGFVIAQGKLSRLVPIENAAMADRSVIQWDKDDLEELGLLKVDVLALGMLSALRRTLELVGAAARHGVLDAGHPGRRPGHLRHDLRGRHHRRVPDRIARANEHAAAHAAAHLLRPGDRSGGGAPGPDPGRHGASVPAAPPGPGSRSTTRSPR